MPGPGWYSYSIGLAPTADSVSSSNGATQHVVSDSRVLGKRATSGAIQRVPQLGRVLDDCRRPDSPEKKRCASNLQVICVELTGGRWSSARADSPRRSRASYPSSTR